MEVSGERQFWPYDEVQFSGDFSAGKLKITTPWMDLNLGLSSEEVPRIQTAVESFQAGQLDEETCFQIQRLCSSLSHLPFAYILPKQCPKPTEDKGQPLHPTSPSSDRFFIGSTDLDEIPTPAKLLSLVLKEAERPPSFTLSLPEQTAIQTLLHRSEFQKAWTWDHEAALQFAEVIGGFDPIALFSVMKRFHLLDSVENNQTELLYAKASTQTNTKKDAITEGVSNDLPQANPPENLLKSIVRQNHYVTEMCESSLRPALALSKVAQDSIAQFMRDENGHDKILCRALVELGVNTPNDIPVHPSTRALMAAFRRVSNSNLLAFSAVVDQFERSSYRDKDPLAALLEGAGQQGAMAGSFIDQHRQINDGGHHEEVALQFLKDSNPVTRPQAIEAMIWAELMTRLLHEIPIDLLSLG